MEYQTIRVTTLRGDQKLTFDAYMKVADKMILYVRRGESFEGERLKRLKEKKLKKMYIVPEQEIQYREYLQRNIEIAYDEKSGRDIQTRAEIVQGQQQNNVEEVFENPSLAEAYYNAKEMAARYAQFILGNSQAVGAILKLENLEKSITHHGVSVAALAVAIGQRLGVLDPKQTQMLTLGGLLHDFGHYESSINPAQDLKLLSPQAMQTYKAHPSDGAMKVQDKKHFDASVIKAIVQHEEFIDGSGFPNGLKENQMDPLAVIVATANAADRLISFEGVAKDAVVKKLMVERMGKHPLSHLQFLGDILKA